MTSKIKNIIIFVAIAAVFGLGYYFFLRPAPDQGSLVSSTALPDINGSPAGTSGQSSSTDKDFLPLLLSAQNIKLNNAIFSDSAFINLHDSSIILTPDGTEGRSNPFAQFGNDSVSVPPAPLSCVSPQILDTLSNTCITPPPTCTAPKVLNPSTNTCFTPLTCKLPKVLDSSTNTCVTPASN